MYRANALMDDGRWVPLSNLWNDRECGLRIPGDCVLDEPNRCTFEVCLKSFAKRIGKHVVVDVYRHRNEVEWRHNDN